MPPWPGPHLILIQSTQALGLLEALFDGPSCPHTSKPNVDGQLAWAIAQEVGSCGDILSILTNNQPAASTGQVVVSLNHLRHAPMVETFTLAPGATAELLPMLLRPTSGQLIDPYTSRLTSSHTPLLKTLASARPRGVDLLRLLNLGPVQPDLSLTGHGEGVIEPMAGDKLTQRSVIAIDRIPPNPLRLSPLGQRVLKHLCGQLRLAVMNE